MRFDMVVRFPSGQVACQSNDSDSTLSSKTSTKSAFWMRDRIFG